MRQSIKTREAQEKICEEAVWTADGDEKNKLIEENKCPPSMMDKAVKMRKDHQRSLLELQKSVAASLTAWEAQYKVCTDNKEGSETTKTKQTDDWKNNTKKLKEFYEEIEKNAKNTYEDGKVKYKTWEVWNGEQVAKQQAVIDTIKNSNNLK